MLSALLEHRSEAQVIKDILSFDLSDENQVRRLFNKKHYLRYLRLSAITDQRKALSILLSTVNQHKSLINRLLKEGAYPVFLYGLSLVMLLFVDRILLQTFQTMLAFLGPLTEVASYQSWLRILIGLDITLMGCVVILMMFLEKKPSRLYELLLRIKSKNLWASLISHEFCMKFFMFYQLGYSIDQIFPLIRDSSGSVLAQRCSRAIQVLQDGGELHNAVAMIDPRLSPIFRLSDEGVNIEVYLENHNHIQERLIANQIKRASKGLLAFDYMQIALIIIIIYQMMLKPIEMMGNFL